MIVIMTTWKMVYRLGLGRSNTVLEERRVSIMAKTFKDKLKNAGEFISETIADVGKQAKDSEMIDKISNEAKDGLVFVSNGVKDGAKKLSNGAKSGADVIKNVVAEHKKQGVQDVIESKEQEDNKEK